MSKAADKTHKITITKTTIVNDRGIEKKTITTVKNLWASVEHRNASEKWSAGRMNPDVTDMFTAGFSSGIDRKMGVTYGSKKYEIVGVEDIRDEHREIVIQAKEVI